MYTARICLLVALLTALLLSSNAAAQTVNKDVPILWQEQLGLMDGSTATPNAFAILRAAWGTDYHHDYVRVLGESFQEIPQSDWDTKSAHFVVSQYPKPGVTVTLDPSNRAPVLTLLLAPPIPFPVPVQDFTLVGQWDDTTNRWDKLFPIQVLRHAHSGGNNYRALSRADIAGGGHDTDNVKAVAFTKNSDMKMPLGGVISLIAIPGGGAGDDEGIDPLFLVVGSLVLGFGAGWYIAALRAARKRKITKAE